LQINSDFKLQNIADVSPAAFAIIQIFNI